MMRTSLTAPFGRLAGVPQTLTSPNYHWLTRPLLAFIVTRLIVFGAALVGEIAFPSPTGPAFWHVAPQNILVDVWSRWDSGFYLSIAQHGYHFVAGQQSTVAFFPVYPLLVNLLALVMPVAVAGIVVSNAALFFALVFLYRLAAHDLGDSAAATRTIFYLAAFPTAFFFSAVYTESLFLLLVIATVYFARTQQWGWAAAAGVLCSATRIIGVLVWGVAVLEWARVQSWTLGGSLRPASWRRLGHGLRHNGWQLALLCLIPLGLVSYMLFLYRQFGDPLAFWTVQNAWGRQSTGPVAVILHDLSALRGSDFLRGTNVWWTTLFDLPVLLILTLSVPLIWRRLGESYALFTLLAVLIPAWSASMSMMRYALAAFPFFLLLGLWGKHPLVDRTLTVGFAVFLGLFTAIFVNWIFVA